MIHALQAGDDKDVAPSISKNCFALLLCSAGVSLVVYGVITFLSRFFDYHVAATSRPIISVLLLYGFAFSIYLFSILIVV